MPLPLSDPVEFERCLAHARESEHLEFKEARNTFSLDKLIEYSAALANERGGQLVLGVSDSIPRQVVGTQVFLSEGVEAPKKRVFDHLQLRIEITEVLCTNGRAVVVTVPSRPIGRPVAVNGRFLMRVGESLTPMSVDQLDDILKEARPVTSTEAAKQQHGFLCGKRLQRVRLELGLKTSHMVDLVEFPGERAWIAAEQGSLEVTEEQLARLVDVAGVDELWLRHGDGQPYPPKAVNDFSWRTDLAPLAAADLFDLAMAIEPESMTCFLLHRVSDTRTDHYQFTFSLDFWRWADDHGHIPDILACLQWLRHQRKVVLGSVLDKRVCKSLLAGELCPAQLGWPVRQRSYWFDDLFDLAGSLSKSNSRHKEHGDWFGQLHKSLLKWGQPRKQAE